MVKNMLTTTTKLQHNAQRRPKSAKRATLGAIGIKAVASAGLSEAWFVRTAGGLCS
jgi:hypothetical protein